jgi:hypothetical protein
MMGVCLCLGDIRNTKGKVSKSDKEWNTKYGYNSAYNCTVHIIVNMFFCGSIIKIFDETFNPGV